MGNNKIDPLEIFEPIANSAIIFDGIERNIYGKLFSIELFDESKVFFLPREFTEYKGNDLSELSEILGNSTFKAISQYFDFKLKANTSSHYYKTEEHLSLKFFQKNNLFFVFTFGEKQPSRWILILEAAYKVNNLTIET